MNDAVSQVRPWVAFDLDGTLTRQETLAHFLYYSLGPWRASRLLLRSLPDLLAYGLGRQSNAQTKERVLRRCLGGQDYALVEEQGRRFAQQGLSPLLLAPVWQRFLAHRQRGDRLVLVTATLGVYARPWALAVGFEAVIATELERDTNDRVTGRLLGPNCFGPEKARRLQTELQIASLDYAYGNSRGDREMLALARHPVCICKANGYGRDLSDWPGA
ncbi:HAD-IB family hydrolase [Acidithiobacillus sp. IBUN Pt1247-S3]|uniref:HAD-IB family hydrolase n=1 Tax=Acidithiobacillus sp. IBUN Pt1247-S3 TaxID=3166642 RepID=UPI0034E4B912